jgi:trigger factor
MLNVAQEMGAQVSFKEIAPCQKELEVQVPPSEVQAEYEEVYKELKKKARVPGFRVGFAPQDLLERYHGDTAKEEVIRRLVGRTMQEALKSQPHLDLVGSPRVTHVQFKTSKEPLTYSAQMEVAPAVSLGRYRGLRLTHRKSEVSQESISQVLAHLQETHAQLKPVLEPRAAQEGDFLLSDLTEQQPGKEPSKRRDVLIHLDLKKDSLGAMKGLLGMTPGTERTVTLQEGQSVTVKLKELKMKEVSPLDDAFARMVGPFEGLEPLKEAIRKDLAKQSQDSQKRLLQGQAAEQLLAAWNFDVPPSLVASQAKRILKDRAIDLLSHGVPSEKVEEQARILTEQAKLDALKEVKLFFILRRIAQEEKLTATEQEVEERVEQLAKQLGVSSDEARKELEAKDLLEELAWGVIREKVFDLILKEAQVNES